MALRVRVDHTDLHLAALGDDVHEMPDDETTVCVVRRHWIIAHKLTAVVDDLCMIMLAISRSSSTQQGQGQERQSSTALANAPASCQGSVCPEKSPPAYCSRRNPARG